MLDMWMQRRVFLVGNANALNTRSCQEKAAIGSGKSEEEKMWNEQSTNKMSKGIRIWWELASVNGGSEGLGHASRSSNDEGADTLI